MVKSKLLLGVGVFLLWAGPIMAESFQARVVGVSAGDIFNIRHDGRDELVVLYGVAAPSTKTMVGQEAQRFASEKILRKQVDVRVMDRRDGLTLVEIDLTDGTNLGQLMLRKGLVKWDSLSAPHDEGLKELQRLAKADHRGLWYDSEALLNAGPSYQIEEVVSIPKPSRLRGGDGYRVLEERTLTDESGTKTLVMRGNGKKQVGFEAAVAQRRLDEYMAVIEQNRLAQEEFQRQQEQQRLASEAASARAEEERQTEAQRIANENAAMFYNSMNRRMLRISTRQLRVY